MNMNGTSDLLVATEDHSNPVGKPRVYFTCHQDDFNRAFNVICNDFFSSQKCAIYYKKDMRTDIPAENKEIDLERMNLFVIPISHRLLSKQNIAMDVDFQFAVSKHIPVLPILIEYIENDLYEKRFGHIQYISRISNDRTEIPYHDKLRKYLKAVLISDEDAKKVRDAFDRYVFLSYRKRDRILANDLLKLIHSRPELRDVAVWYDEFLTPGESFKESIDHILHDKKLRAFTLLVTKNLLKDSNGKPNFIAAEEYPAAKEVGVRILPVEITSDKKYSRQRLTGHDYRILAQKFDGIPECMHLHNEDDAFLKLLCDTICNTATRASDDPVHDFLIGLAYLEGIDVEINHEYALELLERADSRGIVEASKKLSEMYFNGIGVEYDVFRAAEYQIKVVDYWRNHNSTDETKRRLIKELIDIADICLSGKIDKIEPSPGKLLSLIDGVKFYWEAAQLHESVLFEQKENNVADLIVLRSCLSKVCRCLASKGWERTSEFTKDDVMLMCQKYVGCTERIATESKLFDDIYLWKESLRLLLEVMTPLDDSYYGMLKKAVSASRSACAHKESRLPDYIWLLDTIYIYGISRYRVYEQYNNTLEWVTGFFYVVGEIKELISVDSRMRANETICDYFNMKLGIVASYLLNMIGDLLEDPQQSNLVIARRIFDEVNAFHDDYDIFVRDYLLPATMETLNESCPV